jgi:hypothetical protein
MLNKKDPMEIVIVEHMPEYLVASHIAANNWGVYPMNGAYRDSVHRYEAEEIIKSDKNKYAYIVGE